MVKLTAKETDVLWNALERYADDVAVWLPKKEAKRVHRIIEQIRETDFRQVCLVGKRNSKTYRIGA